MQTAFERALVDMGDSETIQENNDGTKLSRKVPTQVRRTLMKRGFLVAVTGPAIVAAGLAGFLSNKSNASPSGSSGPVVLIDGQDQGVENMQVYCHMMPAMNELGGTAQLYNIAIGNTGGLGLTDTNPPQLEHFGFQKQPYNLEYQRGRNSGNAVVIKNGNSYKVTGTATGYYMTTAVTKSFEVDVTCP